MNDLFLEYQNPALEEIMIIGIGANNDIDVDNITFGNILPWVKDNDHYNVWNNWDTSNRDLIFMNKQGKYSYKINITSEFNKNYIKNIIDCIE